ncbi:uncharacterized protein TrAtP1_000389 [Trichoderma atroviride]|uniref:uncharacterized protein n=1 Tax=Hypocrea atroviridis TaxID=63577 RepID=UPI00331EB356|nr:hypothetical protein TrAtP1_000389 [Trichoderma atroviride]
MEVLPVKGRAKSLSLYLYDPTKSTTNLLVCVKPAPGIDLGWTSSTKVSLLYNELLVGEADLETGNVFLTETNVAFYNLEGFKIWNMHGFKAFIQHVIPRPRDESQLEGRGPAVALKIDDKGHKLAISIRLDMMGFAKTLISTVRRIDDEIEVVFFIQNPTRVGICFGETRFILEKDCRILARLYGKFNIVSDDGMQKFQVKGPICSDTTLFGKAILKGVSADKHSDTWYTPAIRLFEMEVDLDALIEGEH